MQVNNSPRFVKNFMIGLIASSAGAFVALPGNAMPETGDVAATELDVAPVEAIAEPSAEETLPVPEEAAAVEADAVTEDVVADDVEVIEEPVADDVEAIEEPVAEEAMETEEVVADDVEAIEEPVADEAMETEEVVAEEEDIEEPVADEAMETEEVIAEEEVIEEPVAEEEVIEEPVADEAVETEEVIAEEEAEVIEEPVAEEEAEVIEEPVAEEEAEVIEEPVAEEEAEVIEEPVADDTDADALEPVTDAETLEEPVAEEEVIEEPVAEEEEINTEDFTIAELTSNSDSFEVLAAALAAAELTEILGSEGPFTVFAPTDEAFAELPEGAVDQLLLPENKDVLVQVLSYHVVPSAVLSTDLETGAVETVEGSEIAVEVGDTITVDNANVVLPDVEASNGVIHIIDRVILPAEPEADAAVEETEAAE